VYACVRAAGREVVRRTNSGESGDDTEDGGFGGSGNADVVGRRMVHRGELWSVIACGLRAQVRKGQEEGNSS
jgi:hypothetical protein